MESSRLTIIMGMAVIAYVIRVVPQLFFMGREFPESFERYLRYLSYALIVSIISTTLFMTRSRFEPAVAPSRALALLIAVLLAYLTGKPLIGIGAGTAAALALSWVF